MVDAFTSDCNSHVGGEQDGIAAADSLVHLCLGVAANRGLHLWQDCVSERKCDAVETNAHKK